MNKYKEYRQLNLSRIAEEVETYWKEQDVFRRSIESREGRPAFVFYEGPPSANGIPGIHHVMARSIKDIFCRYKTLKGFQVKRKAGWDTHGLPVEIGVEKKLGITKEDIGKSITIEGYNKECRSEVMKYKDLWDSLTQKMGYWVDLDNPYITFDNRYIETVWFLLSLLNEKGLLYKGYTIQPFSPAAGTGLSTHELNQPGCYKNVKDNSLAAQFKVIRNQDSEWLFENNLGDLYFLAWTTTPWTLPSNTGLAVGPKMEYLKVQTYNPYSFIPQTVVLAADLLGKWFPEKNAELKMEDYEPGQKAIPFKVMDRFSGLKLQNIRYEQLLPYVQPEEGDSFRVVPGDFVTTEDGTGIVHIAPSFGADDFKVGRQYNLGSLTLVDRQGRFVSQMGEFAGRYVKPQYYPDYTPDREVELNVDIDIIVKLKKENKAFKAEKYEHSYPHCWRTDKPILYYPLDSWFVKTTAYRDRMIELNKTINWKPESTGTGRFGNWLENLVDWNLSRSRYWGVPLPIWATEDYSEQICIQSVQQLYQEIEKSIAAGFMKSNPYKGFVSGDNSAENYQKIDLHRPYVDDIVLASSSGKPMKREPDLIDVWFDSGAMPYAQWHYPFENKEEFQKSFPADFIAEGVDQTRGWFFTLHAIATMAFDSVAFQTVVSNGLVLDKNGNKMSKRLGNAVDPFETIGRFGPDATRWYMITNAQPWDNLKFDIEGVAEVQRKFFGTLYNTYAFYALYANIDGFNYAEKDIEYSQRPEIDRWILSELHSLIMRVDNYFSEFEPTRAGREIQDFVNDHLSNWYVRLCRRRFWKGEMTNDKISAYQTLYQCLETVSILASPIAPFFCERLFCDLNEVSGRQDVNSVHLSDMPVAEAQYIDHDLEERMQLAQRISSMALSLRKRISIRVRQPLQKLLIPTTDEHLMAQIELVNELIKSEINVKEIEFLKQSGFLIKKVKPDFKKLGPRFGKDMKSVAKLISEMNQEQISEIESVGNMEMDCEGQKITILLDDVEIITEDIPGWVVANEGSLTVALDVNISDELREEGMARELVNRIQNIRKESNFEVTDKIQVWVSSDPKLNQAIEHNFSYICHEILATELHIIDDLKESESISAELLDGLVIRIKIDKN